VVLNWGGAPPQGGVDRFQRGREPLCALQQGHLINNLTNEYICAYNLLVSGGLTSGGVVA